MSEPCEFEFVPMKRAVRELVARRERKDVRYFWDKNEFETKTSVSRRIRIAQMLERSQSLLQYCNVVQIARLVFYGPWILHSTTR